MKVNSLKGSINYDSVFISSDYQIKEGPFKLFLKKNSTKDVSLGLIIPKKRISLASNRNFVKRRAREIIRNEIFLGYDIIFLVAIKIKNFNKCELKNHINNLKRKLESLLIGTQFNQ